MAPLREYKGWNTRKSARRQPYRRYYFVCEGRNTERWYFERFIDVRKLLGIKQEIELILLVKTGDTANYSNPKSLIRLAEKFKSQNKSSFDRKHDKMVLVFDADIYEKQQSGYDEILEYANDTNLLAVTNPSFELFLLLHYKDSLDQYIFPNERQIIENETILSGGGKMRPAEYYFRIASGLKPKKNDDIADLAYQIDTAVEQEKRINNDIYNLKGKLTCNVAAVLDSLREESR